MGIIKPTDRDFFGNKRIETVNSVFTLIFLDVLRSLHE